MEQVTGDIADEKVLESVITEDVRRYVSITMGIVIVEGFKGWWIIVLQISLHVVPQDLLD